MKRLYRLSRDAKRDLLDAWKYLSRHASVEVADKIVSEIRAGMDRLTKSPDIGHSRKDLTDLPVRFLRVHPYLIIYAPLEKPLEIVRILHSSRDIPSILGEL